MKPCACAISANATIATSALEKCFGEGPEDGPAGAAVVTHTRVDDEDDAPRWVAVPACLD